MYPQYKYPRRFIIKFMTAMLLSRRREMGADSRAFVSGIKPPMRTLGAENIPEIGPLLVIMNHYSRQGFAVWWLSMAVSSMLPMPHTWISASEWTQRRNLFEHIKCAVSPFLLDRLAQVYGFLKMPPMPPRAQDVEARAEAVRAILAYVEASEKPVICLAPEGMDMPDGKLNWPPAGTGRFIALLAGRGMRILPVGGWEQDGALFINFGPAFALDERLKAEVSAGKGAHERDQAAAKTLMKSIACLLPPSIQGEFA